MTKADLIEAVQAATKRHDLSKVAVTEVIDATTDAIISAIKQDGRFQLPGFGTFTLRHRKERQGINPQTKEPITIKASKTVGFKPSPNLKSQL